MRAEVVERVEDFAKLVGFVGFEAFASDAVQALEDPAVEQCVVWARRRAFRIEAIEVAEQNAQRIAQAAVGLGHLLEQVLAEGNFVLPIDRRNPEAHDVGTVLVVEMRGVDRFAGLFRFGFRKLLLVLVDDEAVSHHRLVRSGSAIRDAEHERALEPSAVLVGGFEIEVRRRVELGMLVEHRRVRAAGIDPHIERVAAFFHACGQAETAGEFGIALFEPEVGAFAFDRIGDLARKLCREDRLAIGAKENRQRHAPGALTRDAPIGPRLDRAIDAVAAPRGKPLDLVDLLKRLATQRFERDEELLDRAKNDRRFRAPAMRVGMFVNFATKQMSALGEDLDDAFVRFEHMRADEFREPAFGSELAFIVDR